MKLKLGHVQNPHAYGKEYFNCTLQKKDGVVRAVCFSPEKQNNVLQLGKSKSPVKIKNFQTKIYQGKPEVVMSKYTKITTLSKEDVNFNYSIVAGENIQYCPEIT